MIESRPTRCGKGVQEEQESGYEKILLILLINKEERQIIKVASNLLYREEMRRIRYE